MLRTELIGEAPGVRLGPYRTAQARIEPLRILHRHQGVAHHGDALPSGDRLVQAVGGRYHGDSGLGSLHKVEAEAFAAQRRQINVDRGVEVGDREIAVADDDP